MSNTENTKPFYNTTIPIDWDVSSLGSVVDKKKKWSFTGGPFGSNLKAADYTETGVRIIQLQNIGDGEFLDNYKIYTSEEKANELLSCNIYPGEIILSKMGDPVARGCFIPNIERRFLMASDGIRIVPDDNKVDNYFLLSFIDDTIFRTEAIKVSTGSTRQRIGLDDLKGLKIPLPPLPEQKAIGHILGLMDNSINQNNLLVAQKELRKKWLMQNLLTGKKRLKGFSGDWKESNLGKLFDRVTRKNIELNTNVVTISAQRGFVRQTDFFKKTIASEIIDNYFLVNKGEFCYNKSYSNGYPWGATKRLNDYEKAVVTTLYICFGIKDKNKTNGDYFEQYFEANYLDKGLTKIAHEGGRAHGLLNVTPSDFFSLKITIPSYEEQSVIAQVLQAADKEILLLKTKTDKLREQKKGMMQVLLTGRKRLKII